MNLNNIGGVTGLTVLEANRGLTRARMVHGAQDENLHDATRILYITMLLDYIVDKRDAVSCFAEGTLDEHLHPFVVKLNERLEAFEKELLDTPFNVD